MSEWCFKVRISNVSAKQLNCAEREQDSMPFCRLNFDGKILQSELCRSIGDPSWEYKSYFEYRLAEMGGIQQVIASLCQRTATMEILYASTATGGREILVGKCSLDLFTLATGSPHLTYDLHKGGNLQGILSFSLSMEQQCIVSSEFHSLTVSRLPFQCPLKLSYEFLSAASNRPLAEEGMMVSSSGVISASSEPHWDYPSMPKILLRCTLSSLLKDTLRVHLCSSDDTKMGHFDLPMVDVVTSNATHTASFKRNLYADQQSSGRNFTALATGTIQFRDLPTFAQLVSGGNTNGAVHGKPLLNCLPLPPRHSKHPQKLPDYDHQQQFSEDFSATLPVRETRNHHPVHHHHPEMDVPAFQGTTALRSPGRTTTSAAIAPPPHRMSDNTFAAPSSHHHHYTSPPRHTSSYPLHQHTRVLLPIESTNTMIPAGSMLTKQHQDAVHAIDCQARRIQEMSGELEMRTVHELKTHEEKMKGLEHEEAAVLDDIKRCERRLEELRVHREECEIEDVDIRKHHAASSNQLANELDELTTLHEHLTALSKNISQHVEEGVRVRSVARTEAENARQRFDYDLRELADVEQKVARRTHTDSSRHFDEQTHASPYNGRVVQAMPSVVNHNTVNNYEAVGTVSTPFMPGAGRVTDADSLLVNKSHQSDANNFASQKMRSPPRHNVPTLHTAPHHQHYPPPPQQELPTLSPSRRGSNRSASVLVESHVAAAPPPSSSIVYSPQRTREGVTTPVPAAAAAADLDELLSAIRIGDAERMRRIMKREPQVILGSDLVLLVACNVEAPNFDIVSTIAHMRSELVGKADRETGNTPLHFICKALVPSVEVLDLLLCRGASPHVFNNDGLTPFHVALLNTADHQGGLTSASKHRLKRFLLFKGPVSIDATTAKGESPAHLCVIHNKHLPSLEFIVQHGGSLKNTALIPDAESRTVAMTPLAKCKMFGSVAEECRRFLETLVDV